MKYRKNSGTMTEITYKMPAEDIRKQRQVFHSLNRKPGESMDFWIYRIDVCSRVCDYGVLTEHMLIDKFMSGLTEDEFDDFSCWGKININKVMLIIFTKTELDICDQVEMSPQFNVQPENTIVNSSISTNQIGVESMNQSNLEDHTYTMTKPQLKGFKTFDSNHVMCLDCHRVFLKTSYSVHRNW